MSSRTLSTFIAAAACAAFFACDVPAPEGEQGVAQPDTLPFTVRAEPAIELDASQAEDEARRVRSSVNVSAAEGLNLTVWATEALVEDPIALDVDDNGDLYVTGSSRSGGLLDIRNHPDWRHDALAMQSVADHEAYLLNVLAPERSDSNLWLPDFNEDGSRDWRDLRVNQERLYRITDSDGDGLADRSRILARGFNMPVSDVLGGLLVHEGDVYLSSAPGLYRIENGISEAPGATSTISWGYGVHPGFFGHGMSGVTVGPDGRIYWSVGDMGLSLVAPDGSRHHYPNQGTVLRSFSDGTGFEVFAAGLRNTHEFDFDARGNLISVDNDGDHPGEMERIVYIVEGSDSGWRVNWQFGKYGDERNNPYKVWMDEELFKPRFDGQAAYITPPIANYHSGPAGMAYNPGTALSDEWNDHFFISEYTGSPATTNVHAFRLETDGAGFELAAEKAAVSGVLTVGIGFGPDGALYLADWIDGWDSKGAGRIWKLEAAQPDADTRAGTRELLASDYQSASAVELADRLAHPDMRVRRKSQFELARRGDAVTLLEAARSGEDEFVRLHGLWGLWQLALRDVEAAEPVVEFLGDAEAEVRAQAAKILGDVRYRQAAADLVPLLADSSERVRFFATQALGRLEHGSAFDAVVAMLEESNLDDTYLRHAGALAMARMGDAGAIVDLDDHPSEPVRLAAVVALRRMKHAGVEAFLQDESEAVITEAARAINDDEGIGEALPDLAALLESVPSDDEALLRRVINANLRVGTAAAARRLADYAANQNVPDAMREEAIAVLGVWPNPSVLDRVDGMYLGPMENDGAAARRAVGPFIANLLGDDAESVRRAAAVAAMRLHIEDAAEPLEQRLRTDPSASVRRAALDALVGLQGPDAEEILRLALGDEEPDVRMRAVRLVPAADLGSELTADLLGTAVSEGSMAEKQSALAALAELHTADARAVLADQMELLEAGDVEPEIVLDVLEALESSGSDTLAARVASYRSNRAPYTAALYGGEPQRGRSIFYDHDGAQCTRCHAIDGRGNNVGPDLAGVGTRLTRQQLLESLVEPAARIAPGFGAQGGPSAMPDVKPVLNERQIRDLVAFLDSLE